MARPEPLSATLRIILDSEAATAALARALAALARPGDVIALSGELGSGKTSFARGFINALPRTDAPGLAGAQEEVPSPTFTLVQIYERAPAPVWHFDLYRLKAPEEVLELGLEEALGEAIVLIEWPERLGAFLPAARLDVVLRFGAAPDAREAELIGGGDWRARLDAIDWTEVAGAGRA